MISVAGLTSLTRRMKRIVLLGVAPPGRAGCPARTTSPARCRSAASWPRSPASWRSTPCRPCSSAASVSSEPDSAPRKTIRRPLSRISCPGRGRGMREHRVDARLAPPADAQRPDALRELGRARLVDEEVVVVELDGVHAVVAHQARPSRPRCARPTAPASARRPCSRPRRSCRGTGSRSSSGGRSSGGP